MRPLTRQELARLKRYASWIRRLTMREWGLSMELTRLFIPASANTTPILPLRLRELEWWLNESNLTYFPIFFSPQLTTIIIFTNPRLLPEEEVEPWDELPHEAVSMIHAMIKAFPSSLQCLSIYVGSSREARFTNEISDFVLRRGESLLEFSTNIVLSTQALFHLMKLPNLRYWTTKEEPAQVEVFAHGVPDGPISFLPSLKILELIGSRTLEWLSFLEAAKKRTPPWVVADDSMPAITYRPLANYVDSPLLSKFLPLSDLIQLCIERECLFIPSDCSSNYTDQDMESLAIALPNLEILALGGSPCGLNTCPTTARSLLSFSIHCTKLKHLSIHFSTENLEVDILDLLGYAYSHDLHLRPKCPLKELFVGTMDIEVRRNSPVLVALGMLMIFPSLTTFTPSLSSPFWTRMGVLMEGLRGTGEPATEVLMSGVSQAREQADNGDLVRAIVSFCHPIEFVTINGILCYSQHLSFLQAKNVHIACEPLSKLFFGDECGHRRWF